MTAGQQKSDYTKPPLLPALSRESKYQLASLIANLVELHRSSRSAANVQCPVAQDRLSDDSDDSTNSIIKEDCHADRRPTLR